ncbi:MAG: fused MFS/spermidine synthase [Chloroflexi bacterium]|nr:fused MFS/spermidine synthase [Chloroflexota bacterium]
MSRMSALWRANLIVFISSFCVMVIELIAARILAPYIGVSLYTWTSIIGVILAGIALGNYLGGKVADRYPSPLLLTAIFLVGGLLTIGILPAIKLVASASWFASLPLMLNFTLKTSAIFFLPAIVLSMVSPLVIKLTLADLGQTGGIVGTIYAVSTAGAILGTFMTGFFFILWFGIRMIVWLVAGALILTGIVTWFSWRVPGRWKLTLKNFVTWLAVLEVIFAFLLLFGMREIWQEEFTKESNYYTIQVSLRSVGNDNVKMLTLDRLVHGYTSPNDPTLLVYDYLKVFEEIVAYRAGENQAPRLLHLGGGAYSFPRYMETVYPESVNEVVEIDPAVTEVAYRELGVPLTTSIKTYNQDARLFLIQRKTGEKYDIVIGDVFNDRSTPFHLTTLEFDRLVKANMKDDGIYLINLIDDYHNGRYLPSFLHTLKQAFGNVYLFSISKDGVERGISTFVIAATDRRLDTADYTSIVTRNGARPAEGTLYDEAQLEAYLSSRKPILLTDDHAPTDILVARLVRAKNQ